MKTSSKLTNLMKLCSGAVVAKELQKALQKLESYL